MQCKCSDTAKEKLMERIIEQLPEGYEGLEVTVGHYVFPFTEKGIDHRYAVPVEIEYQAPKKRGGGMATKKQKTQVLSAFCPHCGERAVPEEATEGEANG